ncbi:ATP-binding protein [Streptomyces sp. NPDC048106]|uniref:ATP-binding protein n=1 Tax=Streptomyces sp. NPDC048106 TaxID=3155750 RepID=UPI003456C0B7
MSAPSHDSQVRNHLDGARHLLGTWPGRFRYPEVLALLARRQSSYGPEDAVELARAVLARLGGRPVRVVCEELLERGEFDAAEYLLAGCGDLRPYDAERLARRLESLRVKAAELVRQRLDALGRRAEGAGVAWRDDPAETEELVEQARSGRPRVMARLDALADDLERRIADAARELAARLPPPARAGAEDQAVARIRALLDAGELVAAAALLNREPPGAPIPEGMTAPPVWKPEWDPRQFLDYHLNPGRLRPPAFVDWRAADRGARELLEAYGRLELDLSAEAAVGFARALCRFLGAPPGPMTATPVENSSFHLAFLDGLFTGSALSRLHPTGRVDLYVGGPGAIGLPDTGEDERPCVAVGPRVEPSGYTDRRPTAVLTLRDLLRLVVLTDVPDRAAALLGILAPQWPVSALAGHSGPELGRILGGEADVAWRTLRWISRLSLGCGPAAVQAMEHCTGMDPHLLLVMLRYAQDPVDGADPVRRWAAAEGGWQQDEELTHALREELTARCGPPVAEAAWWAALAASDAVGGHLGREDAADMAEACGAEPWVRERILTAVDDLARRGLLTAAPDGGGLRIPLSGVVRALRAEAEQQLTALLGRLAVEREERGDGPKAWHLNRYATVPLYARLRETPDAYEELAEEARRRLAEEDFEATGGPDAEPAALLASLQPEFEEAHPHARLDVRCPPGLRVAVPEPVLRAVLYEVMDNAAEALAGQDGLLQILVERESPEVLLVLRDSGPGLPEKARSRPARIFGPTWTTRGEGRGRGLYRVRRFLQSCATDDVSADIEVLASENRALTGAAFQLVLPEQED